MYLNRLISIIIFGFWIYYWFLFYLLPRFSYLTLMTISICYSIVLYLLLLPPRLHLSRSSSGHLDFASLYCVLSLILLLPHALLLRLRQNRKSVFFFLMASLRIFVILLIHHNIFIFFLNLCLCFCWKTFLCSNLLLNQTITKIAIILAS